MSRSRKLVWILAIAAAVLMGMLRLAAAILPRLQLRAICAAATAATGLPCRVGSFSAGGRTARDVEIGPEGRPVLRLDSLRFWTTNFPYVNGLELRGLRLAPPGAPEAAMPGLEVTVLGLEPVARTGQGEVLVVAKGELAELSPLLEARGRVRALRGRFELQGRPKVGPDGALDGVLEVTLRDLLVRGTDGRFEVAAAEAIAQVRLSGSLAAPRADLGGLEPYLGRDFVKSFGGAGK